MKIKDYHYYNNLINSKSNWCTNNNKIMLLKNTNNYTIAHKLAFGVYETNGAHWLCDNLNLLKLLNINNDFVAHWLAFHPHWITKDPNILALKDELDFTVSYYLKARGKL